MKLTDREYRILLAECACRILAGSFKEHGRCIWIKEAIQKAEDIFYKCGIQNESDADRNLKAGEFDGHSDKAV